MKRCSRCVLLESVCGIQFDEQGICNFCHSCREKKPLGREELELAIVAARDQRKAYDCIVPLSGGRDSSYVLYLARAVFNLRVLAVSYDNEFRTEQALVNMEEACERLQVDFQSVRSKRDIAGKIVKCGLRSSVTRKLFRICHGCTYGFKSVVYRTAAENEVPMIFWGDSQPEEVHPLAKTAATELKLRTFRPFFFLNPDYYKSKYYMLRQHLEFSVPGNSPFRKFPRNMNPNIKDIHVFRYIPWDRNQIKETIARELGWEKPRDSISTWRTDCKLSLLVDYCFYKMYGCTKSGFGYCKMINGGHMSRSEALQQEEAKVVALQDGSKVRELLADEVGLSAEEVERVLAD